MRKTFKKRRRQSGGSWFRNLFTQKVHPNKTDETDEYIKSVNKDINYFNTLSYPNPLYPDDTRINNANRKFKLIDDYIAYIETTKDKKKLGELNELKKKIESAKLNLDKYYADKKIITEEKLQEEKELQKAREKATLQQQEKIKLKKQELIHLIREHFKTHNVVSHAEFSTPPENDWIDVNDNKFIIRNNKVELWIGLEPNWMSRGAEYYFLCDLSDVVEESSVNVGNSNVGNSNVGNSNVGGKSKKRSKKRKKRTNRKRTY